MANILEIKTENFKIEQTGGGSMLMLAGPPSKGASIVLFRPSVSSQNAAAISKKELDIFKSTAMNWEQNQRKLGFFVIELANSPKLVKSSMTTNTNLNVACSICIFYYTGSPIMFLKKIPLDNPYEIRTFCTNSFARIESSISQRPQNTPQGGGMQRPPQQPHSSNGGPSSKRTYQPEGLSMPSMSSLRHTKDSYQEESLLVPPDIIPKNAPWMIEE
jgi:hypothetical protein